MSTKNITPVKVPVFLDQERTICFDMNAFIELEDLFGSIDKAFKVLTEKKESVKPIRTILRIGLLHEDESLTEKQVGQFIGLQGFEPLSELLVQAFSGALPDVPAEKN